jgi:hypothetical protein
MVAGEICYSLGALCLLEFAVDMLEDVHSGETRGRVYSPVAVVLEVI